MFQFDPNQYGPRVAELLRENRLAPFGPGKPNSEVENSLRDLTIAKLADGKVFRDADMARCCVSGLWLYHDFLDESHRISQEIKTASGSYWHGIMHRREPDASNAAYWFRRVGDHPIFELLWAEARKLGLQSAKDCWNPFAFIDFCEQERGTGSSEELKLRQVQAKEWELLFDWCFQQA